MRARHEPDAEPRPAGLDALAAHLAAGGVVAFTGAGVSTASGIPDFRSPGGVWTRYNPRDFTFSRYVARADTRRRAWQLRRELWAAAPAPNAAHRALAELERRRRLDAVVTQNIDGLHTDVDHARVVELHGSGRRVLCIGAAPRAGTPAGCGFTASMDWAVARLDAGEADPACPECGGLLKSATVSFGQNLFPGVLAEAERHAAAATTLLAVGSSLQVQPAASVPEVAVRAGARLAIVNREPTPLDDLADVVVRGEAADVLPAAMAAASPDPDESDPAEPR
jgi:NAD-dependent deacetylase